MTSSLNNKKKSQVLFLQSKNIKCPQVEGNVECCHVHLQTFLSSINHITNFQVYGGDKIDDEKTKH